MLDSIRTSGCAHVRIATAAIVAAAAIWIVAEPVGAQDAAPGVDAAKKEGDSRQTPILPPTDPAPLPPRVGDKLSFSSGVDFSSHFISFGADVWGGGNEAYPFSDESTAFAYSTLTAKFSDEFSGFVNIWNDINNNVESGIGGELQEVDVNVGGNYTYEKFTFGLAHNYWIYSGEEEKAVELSVSFSDADVFADGFALNPSLLLHYRYDGIGAQEEAMVVQLGVRPTFYFREDTDEKITLAVPASVGFFTDDYQGGEGGGFGYVNVGVSASFPLTFIPEGYGAWTAGLSATLWHTPDDAIPGNPDETFVVTALSVGLSF